jgi:hypothetical protein
MENKISQIQDTTNQNSKKNKNKVKAVSVTDALGSDLNNYIKTTKH